MTCSNYVDACGTVSYILFCSSSIAAASITGSPASSSAKISCRAAARMLWGATILVVHQLIRLCKIQTCLMDPPVGSQVEVWCSIWKFKCRNGRDCMSKQQKGYVNTYVERPQCRIMNGPITRGSCIHRFAFFNNHPLNSRGQHRPLSMKYHVNECRRFIVEKSAAQAFQNLSTEYSPNIRFLIPYGFFVDWRSNYVGLICHYKVLSFHM